MRFLEFRQKLAKFIIFGLQDIRAVQPDFDLRRLSEWQDKGYIRQVRRGFYVFSDLKINEEILFLIANKIYKPSYISLESALAYYGLIPEGVFSVTSVTSKKTNVFKTPLTEFNYRMIKPSLMFGYELRDFGDIKFKIAEPEKAVLDYFYFNSSLKTEDDFAGMRFKVHEFKELFDKNKFLKYLEEFNSKALEKRINKFLKYIMYA